MHAPACVQRAGIVFLFFYSPMRLLSTVHTSGSGGAQAHLPTTRAVNARPWGDEH